MSRAIDRQPETTGRTLRQMPARGEWVPLALLALFLIAVSWHRFAFDSWLHRFDLFTYFIPWYAFMGERLRDFDVPGWNPHLFSGTLFAGHPISGWMYWPAMLSFSLLPVLAAFKTMVAIQLAVAGFGMYALARRLGMGPWAALVAGAAYISGPLLEWNTACCLHFSEFATWLPLALLGADCSLGARDRLSRWAWWFVAGFAISQILAGWVGEGWIYALLLIGGFTLYRALTLGDGPTWQRFARASVTGFVVFGLGTLLGAAGVWPRLALNAGTNLASGDYGQIGDESLYVPPWNLDYLLAQIAGFGTGYHARAVGIGGAIMVLALLAPLLARGRHAVPFFAGVTVIAYMLTLDTTPVHELFYLIPRYEELHRHDPWRIVAVAGIGPPLLAGASVEALRSVNRFPGWVRVAVAAPLLLVIVVLLTGESVEAVISWPVLIAALLTTAIVAIALTVRNDRRAQLAWAVPLLIFTLVAVQPAGLEMTGAWLDWPEDPRWQARWNPDPTQEQALRREIQDTDPGGAGEFLQAELARSGPFRFAGYSGYTYPGAGRAGWSHMARRFDPNIQAILSNGRPMFLGLYDIQGYDPIQLAPYVTFMNTLNGAEQDYHTAFLLPTGVNSPLLDLLNVRFLLLDATLPPDRDDVIALTQGRHEVYRNEMVVIFERDQPLPHAWIVHDVQAAGAGEAAPRIVLGQIDPWRTGLVNGPLPVVSPAVDAAGEQARVTRYEADSLTISANLTAPGLLIVSEIVADGWYASVDGDDVPILTVQDVLRGVALPAGEHEITFRYEPVSLRYGLPVSAAAHLAMLLVFGFAAWRITQRSASETIRNK